MSIAECDQNLDACALSQSVFVTFLKVLKVLITKEHVRKPSASLTRYSVVFFLVVADFTLASGLFACLWRCSENPSKVRLWSSVVVFLVDLVVGWLFLTTNGPSRSV